MRAAATAVALLAAACRPDIGAPDYPEPLPIGSDTSDPTGGFLPGPDPWVAGEDRLSIGVFYEGGASEVVEIDNTTTHLYVYDNSFAFSTTDDRIEGFMADVLTRGTGGYWGGGVHWDAARDLSSWTTLHVHLKSPDAGMASLEIGMVGGDTEGRVSATDYGFATDDAWHALSVPLSDLAAEGVDLSDVSVALILIGVAGSEGDELIVDNLYITAE